MCKHFLTSFETHESHDEPFIEIWNRRPLLMSAYSIVEHQQGCSVEEGINFSLSFPSLEVTNSHVNWIPVRKSFCPTQNRNAFAFVASPKIYCTSRRAILRTFPRFVFVCFVLKTGVYRRTFWLWTKVLS